MPSSRKAGIDTVELTKVGLLQIYHLAVVAP